MLGTLENAGRVLSLFTVAQPEWGVSQASSHLGAPKSTVHATFAALAAIDLLERRPNRRYRLGWRFVEQSQTLLQTTRYRPHALRAMRQVVARHGETMHLATWSRSQVVYVETLQPVHGVLGAVMQPDRRPPAHGSAVGKVLLAGQRPRELEAFLSAAHLARTTERTITALSSLRHTLAETREQGFAYDHEESRPGVCCVAAPLRDRDGTVIAAISICAPQQRFDRMRQEYRRAAVMAADEASSRLRRSDAAVV